MNRTIAVLVSFLVFVCSCEKNITEELKHRDDPNNNADTVGGVKKDDTTARFSISSITVLGDYYKDSIVLPGTQIDLNIKVIHPGHFRVASDTVSGLSFYIAGNLDSGTSKISAVAFGKPTATGNLQFTIRRDTISVPFTVLVSDPNDPVFGPKGSIAGQRKLYYNTLGGESMLYKRGTSLISTITSGSEPPRGIFYNQNGKIDRITYTYYGGFVTTDQFYYNQDNEVSMVVSQRFDDPSTSDTMRYTWNPDHTIASKNGHVYTYENGNLTGINAGTVNAISATYDNRENTFPQIGSQFYFLDYGTAFDQTDRSEIFYFSKNFPISYENRTIAVTTYSNGMPEKVYIDGDAWYVYGFF